MPTITMIMGESPIIFVSLTSASDICRICTPKKIKISCMTTYTAYALKMLPSLTSTISVYRTKFRVEMTCHQTTVNDTSIQKSLFSNLNSQSHDK